MALVSSQETRPEILVRQLLFKNGYRYRKNVKSLPGKPDIVLPKYKIIILVHGCFWHQHEGCKKSQRPTSRTDFWNQKLDDTIARDTKNLEQLTALGWKVIIVWECELKQIDVVSNKLLTQLG